VADPIKRRLNISPGSRQLNNDAISKRIISTAFIALDYTQWHPPI